MILRRLLFVVWVAAVSSNGSLRADKPQSLGAGEFERIHQMIKPQPGESRWMEIDWYPSIWEARQKAASEGKPIFMMAGSGGAPAAGC
jgi:hypothetical protein